MQSRQGWKWYGFAGHFIMSSRCAYHLATLIGGRYLVSTVGALRVDPEQGEFDNVNTSHKFETMVFECDGEDQHGNPNIIDCGNCLELSNYNDSKAAELGHYHLCEAYHRKLEEEVCSS